VLAGDAFGVSRECERPVSKMRQHNRRDGGQIPKQVTLGEAPLPPIRGPHLVVKMAQLDRVALNLERAGACQPVDLMGKLLRLNGFDRTVLERAGGYQGVLLLRLHTWLRLCARPLSNNPPADDGAIFIQNVVRTIGELITTLD